MGRDRRGPSPGGSGRSPRRRSPASGSGWRAWLRRTRRSGSRFRDDASSFDAELWSGAFTSDRPQTINEVLEVTGGYEGLVNHLMEMLQAGASLVGLAVTRQRHKPSGPELIAAATNEGCFTENQAKALNNLNRTRNRLRHSSPGVLADEVHERTELLLKAMPRLLSSYVRWMEARGIRLLPDEPS